MILTRRFKAGCLMTLLVGFCLGIGFIFGILAHQAWKKKTEQPEFMKWAALRQLEKLSPTPEQRPKLEAQVDATITELTAFKSQTLNDLWDIIDRRLAEIDQDLTPEQRAQWARIKPKRPTKVK